MKLSSILTITYCAILESVNLNAQSTTELHNRYWTYRENFRKYFTSIGLELPSLDIKLTEKDYLINSIPVFK
jgi:hypothetical protein